MLCRDQDATVSAGIADRDRSWSSCKNPRNASDEGETNLLWWCNSVRKTRRSEGNMPATFGVVLAAARIPAMIFTPLQFPSKNHKPYLLLKITKCSLLSSSSSSLSPLLSPPLPSSPLFFFDSILCPVLFFRSLYYVARSLEAGAPHETRKQATNGRSSARAWYATDQYSFLIFCGEFAHCGDQKKLSANSKRDLFWKKKKLKNSPYFEEKQVTYRHI